MGRVQIEKKYSINIAGIRCTPPIYDGVYLYEKSVIAKKAKDKCIKGHMLVSDSKFIVEGFSVEDGKKLFCIDNAIVWLKYENYCIIKKDNNKLYIFFDDKQKIYGPFDGEEQLIAYDYIFLTKYIKQNDKVRKISGIYDQYGDVILPIEHDEIKYNYDEMFLVNKKGKLGLYDIDGSCLMQPIYDYLECISSDTCFIKASSISSKGKYGIFTRAGVEVLRMEYDSISYIEKFNVFAVKKDELWGLVNADGNNLLSAVFEAYDVINNTPFIRLQLCGNTLYYNVQSNKLFQESAIKLCKHKYKYFDEKWYTVSY